MASKTFIAVSALATAAAFAQSGEPIAYPARGQDAKQQDQDRYQCYEWARGQSGFDPTRVAEAPPMPAAPPPQQQQAQQQQKQGSNDPTGGMAKGAIGGAAIGELAHKDVGHAAAAGALGSGLITKMKQQQASKQASATAPAPMPAAPPAPNPRMQQKATYDRAFAACLEGRGYTVR